MIKIKGPKGERGFVKIIAPKARVDQSVLVENYRKDPRIYEPGIVTRTDFNPESHLNDRGWSYTVRLVRRSGKGNPIDLTVSDDGISFGNDVPSTAGAPS